ncbi:hypothetical protein [Massilia sp. Leaf139]|uniref:hypothetical protein n=1 Tax=Massilia sp. Leaf139 TaxID=1736272 RepID=UPI0006FF5EBF|nr:hypothetical protein [Massilia sp. Leaf139]KQQ93642.1 hypothetical protein ASF77_22420 [Massilia sp. Leaf139]
MSIKEKTDAELVADARQLTEESNRLHREVARRGITIDWVYGETPGTIDYKYSRVTTESL